MARLRYSREEARAEARRRAEMFVASRADRDQLQYRSTFPDILAPPSKASKHPVAWVVVFAPIAPDDSVIDGGELFVVVDLEFGTVKTREF